MKNNAEKTAESVTKGHPVRKILSGAGRALALAFLIVAACYSFRSCSMAKSSLSVGREEIVGKTFYEASGDGFLYVGESYGRAKRGEDEVAGPYAFSQGRIDLTDADTSITRTFSALSADEVISLEWDSILRTKG